MRDGTPKQNLGRLVMIGIGGHRLTKRERRFLKEIRPAGVVYFRRNVGSPRQLRALSGAIRRILGPGALIGIDQEGGRVARLGPPFTVFPGNDFLGRILNRTGRTTLATEQAEAMAKELRSVGVNLNFTPVADIDSNPRNPVIGRRSFGKDPGTVARLVAATVRAYDKAGVLSCAKHFPGHGDTSTDSHKVLPVARASATTLRRRELVPFRAAVRSGVPAIMSAHVVYPALDRRNPATFSPKIVGDLLRKKLGFRGVTISDDLEMNAVALHTSVPEAGVRALRAGCDLLLVCKTLDLAGKMVRRIEKGVRGGELDRERTCASVRRIERLAERLARNRLRPIALRSGGWPGHGRVAKKIETLGREILLGE